MKLYDNRFITIYRDNDFEAFYEVGVTHRRKLILAHMIINLLPLVMAWFIASALEAVGSLYWLFTGIAVLMYVIVSVETIAYMFPDARRIFKRIFPWTIPALALVGGYLGYVIGLTAFGGSEEEALPGTLAYAIDYDLARTAFFYGMMMGGFFLAHAGTSLFLKASRVLYTKRAELESDVRFAREVQGRFLQDASLEQGDGGLTAFGRSVPASELGGDYFELTEMPDGHWIASVGDISGHSFGAGLLMSVTKSALQTHLSYQQEPDEILGHLNQMLVRQSDRSMFATMVLLSVQPETREIRLSNAGHIPVYHYVAATQTLEKRHIRGMALGMSARVSYENLSFRADAGDVLIVCSDGLTETRDEAGKVRDFAFFETMLREQLQQTPATAGARSITESLLARVEETNFATQPEDDITLIVLRF